MLLGLYWLLFIFVEKWGDNGGLIVSGEIKFMFWFYKILGIIDGLFE